MTEIFMTHAFKKICSEPRGRGLDELIKNAVIENTERLHRLVDNEDSEWVKNILNLNAIFFALSQLQNYYNGGNVSEEQWELASYYTYQKLTEIDGHVFDIKR